MSSRLHINQMKNDTVDTSSKILGKLDCINRGQFDTRYTHTGLHNGSRSWLGTAFSIDSRYTQTGLHNGSHSWLGTASFVITFIQ